MYIDERLQAAHASKRWLDMVSEVPRNPKDNRSSASRLRSLA
jgi:hypothetical protein